MNQVECGVASCEIPRQGLGNCQIRFPNLHAGILSPFASQQFARRADETANVIARIEQERSETATNVASSSCYRDKLRFGSFNQVVCQIF